MEFSPRGVSDVLQLEIILLLLYAAALICCIVMGTPKPFRDPARHVLICCAHSDDCVIMGAEYAYGAIQNGLSVRIAYLTCSGPNPDAGIARTRRVESLGAWSTLGIPKENFTFINLSESPAYGPPNCSDQEIAFAKETLRMLILSLPENAAVIIPAQGEFT